MSTTNRRPVAGRRRVATATAAKLPRQRQQASGCARRFGVAAVTRKLGGT
jgi:hypothetical protein